jgi:Uma2 family endonuclease
VDVGEYWLVDPNRNLVVVYRQGTSGFKLPQLRSAAAGHVLRTDLLPDLQIPTQAPAGVIAFLSFSSCVLTRQLFTWSTAF